MDQLYVIRNQFDELLYWSNTQGWVDIDDATRFNQLERDILTLPIDGVWDTWEEYNEPT